jgi:hypothetical protein
MVEAFWGIASIAATLAGMIGIWRKDPSQRRSVIITFLLLVALIGTSDITAGILVYERAVKKLQADIPKILVQQARSAEDIREELSVDPSLVDKALSRCLEEGTVEQKTSPVVMSDNTSVRVRLYYATAKAQAANTNEPPDRAK